MPILPEDEPFGIATGLKPPSLAAAERAKPLFERFLSGEATATGPLPPTQFGGGRRYDVALSIVAMLAGPAPDAEEQLALPDPLADEPTVGPDVHDEVTRVGSAPDSETPLAAAGEPQPHLHHPPPQQQHPKFPLPLGDEETAALPPRPPPGAPMVRRSPPPRSAPTQDAQSSPEELAEKTVSSAMYWSDAAGEQTFQLAFKDDVFKALSCTLTVAKGRVTATFQVTDDNQRRLLEGEAATLRQMLEKRGLKVDQIRVVLT